jgi:precorrin-4/cobalt-precorrin-4 C11-methyltransferase
MNDTERHPVVFVGAGPGDPELITVAGMRALEAADLVVYAGSLVSRDMLQWTKPDTRHIDSAGLNLKEIVDYLADGYEKGLRVVRLHTGDPSLYGAVAEQFRILNERKVPYRVIPGVTAAFAAAAALKMEFTLPETCQTLILTRIAGRTPVPETEDLGRLAESKASLAIYLSAGKAEDVAAKLTPSYGEDAPVAVVYRASWPDEKSCSPPCGIWPRTWLKPNWIVRPLSWSDRLWLSRCGNRHRIPSCTTRVLATSTGRGVRDSSLSICGRICLDRSGCGNGPPNWAWIA